MAQVLFSSTVLIFPVWYVLNAQTLIYVIYVIWLFLITYVEIFFIDKLYKVTQVPRFSCLYPTLQFALMTNNNTYVWSHFSLWSKHHSLPYLSTSFFPSLLLFLLLSLSLYLCLSFYSLAHMKRLFSLLKPIYFLFR